MAPQSQDTEEPGVLGRPTLFLPLPFLTTRPQPFEHLTQGGSGYSRQSSGLGSPQGPCLALPSLQGGPKPRWANKVMEAWLCGTKLTAPITDCPGLSWAAP